MATCGLSSEPHHQRPIADSYRKILLNFSLNMGEMTVVSRELPISLKQWMRHIGIRQALLLFTDNVLSTSTEINDLGWH